MSGESNPSPWIVPGKWSVSPFNFEPEVRAAWQLPRELRVHDATLRDGEQWPGVVFQKEEKLRIAHALAEAGVDRIEGGMPAISEEDAEAITAMAREVKGPEISCLSRARHEDLELAARCGVQHVIMEIPTLPAELLRIWGSVEKTVETYVAETEFAARHGIKVTLFLMEASRSQLGLLKDVVGPISRYGKIVGVGVVDTRGSAFPEAMAWLVRHLRTVTTAPIEVHAHNVWGMGTAVSLAAVTAGAEIVHTAVNGLNGNAALDECVMGARALLGLETHVQCEQFTALSKMVREAAGVGWYKAFLGEGVSQIEIGLPSRSMWERRHEVGYGRAEPLNYETVGGQAIDLVLGKKSGGYSLHLKAWELGLALPSKEATAAILSDVKALSQGEKRTVTNEEFKAFHAARTAEFPGEPGV